MRLDLDSLYTEARPDAFNGAKKRFYDNRVSGVGINASDNKITLSGSVSGVRNHQPHILFGLQGDLYDYECDCGRDFLREGPCKHILAVALSYEEKNPAANKYESVTDAAALKAIAYYSERRGRASSDSEKQHLYPLLMTENGRAGLKLFVGGRRYKVKNIPLMLQRVERREFHRYGNDLAFFHAKEKFDDRSAALIGLLTASIAEKARLSIKEDEYKDVFYLLQNDVDLFFELYENHSVNVYDDIENSARVHPEVDSLRTVMNINRDGSEDCTDKDDINKDGICKESGGFKICLSSRPENLIYGRKFAYCLAAGGIYKCSHAYLDCVLPLIRLLSAKKEIYVSAKDMPLFYNNVIFKTSEYISIESDCDLSRYEMPDLAAKLFISREGSAVVGRLECFYDDTAADIFNDFYADTLLRDWQQESSLKESILRYFPLAPLLRLEEEPDIYNLAAYGLADINKYAEIFLAEGSLLKIRRQARISVGVRLNGGLLDVSISGADISDKELKAIMQGLKADRGYVRMADGSFINLNDPLFASLKKLGRLSGGDTEFLVPKYYAPFFEEELTGGFVEFEYNRDFKNLLTNFSAYNDSDLAMPATLNGIMRGYQKTGVKWLSALIENSFGGILADDMGLGKSLQLIALLLIKRSFPCLIVCPTTLILNWAAEFARFAPQLKLLTVMGTAAQRLEDVQNIGKYDVVITSYKLLSRDITQYESIKFSIAAADEAQFIKNPETAAARAIKRINSDHRLALTGTPIENKLSELWSIFDFIMPKYLGSYAEFSRRFELPLLSGDKRAADELISLTSPFILRRMKSEVLTELPPKIETEMISPLEDEQKEFYYRTLALIKQSLGQSLEQSINRLPAESQSKNSQKDFKPKYIQLGNSSEHPKTNHPAGNLSEGFQTKHSPSEASLEKSLGNPADYFKFGHLSQPGGEHNRMAILAQLTKLRQICCDPILADQFYSGNSAKTEMCLQLVEDAIAGGHKILLFSQFTSMLEILRSKLEEIGASYYLLKGDTPKPERIRMANRFNKDDTNVFLISLKAGGTGLNLTGADVVILYDPWWNDPVMNQATDRAYRLGQEKSVHVYKLIMENTIEQKIQLLQQKKNALSGLLVDKAESLNMEKIMELLE